MDPPAASQPLVAGGLKDSHDTITHGKSRPHLVLRASEALPDAPGRYPILDPYTEKRVGFSVDDLCARRMLREGLVRVIRSSKKIRGLCPILHKREPVKVVIMRGVSIGKPVRSGPSWVQGKLAGWAWHEIFYAVLNSVREKPFEPWTWEEIVSAVQSSRKKRKKRVSLQGPSSLKRRLLPPLKKVA